MAHVTLYKILQGFPIMWACRESCFAWDTKPSLSCLLRFHSTSLLQPLPWNLTLPPYKKICSSCSSCTIMSLSVFFWPQFEFPYSFKAWVKCHPLYEACQTETVRLCLKCLIPCTLSAPRVWSRFCFLFFQNMLWKKRNHRIIWISCITGLLWSFLCSQL